ncbi:HepT-like ribonuclease domain-containing protein [Curtobacterium sp. Leaf261]|uniref:HepT-like ribonuclease domain-containing protein n=1 Tax=Curtobacterium sp. Leaf261 TaxID=1736311 RepID=UPI0006FF718A|nr:HepT-like ribonuclease domain-containing protein [Curtobacterium sp. Leaf261]KQO61344.1 hypothetical protein ASF23_12730 [Curtobacterium sp. Leaf261]
MSRRAPRERLDDIRAACAAIEQYVALGEDREWSSTREMLRYDAVRMRLVEIGIAVGALPERILAHEPTIPWRHVAELGARLTSRSFDTGRALVLETARVDVPRLRAAVDRLVAASV